MYLKKNAIIATRDNDKGKYVTIWNELQLVNKLSNNESCLDMEKEWRKIQNCAFKDI